MYVATIGFFDGVHRGHRCLIEQVLDIARERKMESMLITMDSHPKTVIDGKDVPRLLTTHAERRQLLEETGAGRIEILHTDKTMMKMSALEFMQGILHPLGVSVLVMGYDHNFGHGGGTHEQYVKWGSMCGIEVVLAHRLDGDNVSSSHIRRLLLEGDVEHAGQLLGHSYILSGLVVSGRQIGREIGFPTANIHPACNKLIPSNGVYYVSCTIESQAQAEEIKGILNIGTRPTLANGSDRSIEVHLVGYKEDLYGQTLMLRFNKRIRDEKKFASLEELRQQIQKDMMSVL